LRGRLRNCNGVFDRKDIRGAFKHLRQGKILWYAPDQDYGPEQAVYAPFFGQPAATITAGSRFAAFNNSPVVLVRHHRLARKPVYVIEFIPVPEPFPGTDDVADATLINRMLEDAILRARTGQGAEMEAGFTPRRTVDLETSQAAAEFRPFRYLKQVGPRPVLFIVAQHEQLFSNEDNAYAASQILEGPTKVLEIPNITHFDIFVGEPFQISANAAADWFKKYL